MRPLTGEPYAGNPPVRFGGRGGATAPFLPLSSSVDEAFTTKGGPGRIFYPRIATGGLSSLWRIRECTRMHGEHAFLSTGQNVQTDFKRF